MIKYLLATGLFAAMAVTIGVIDMRSGDATMSPSRAAQSSPDMRIYATGIVEGAAQEAQLRPELAGRVAEVLVAAGDWVEKDGVLLRLDGAHQEREVTLAEANVELARAEAERIKNGARAEEREEARALLRAAQSRLQQAVQTWDRIKPLRNEQAISQQDADNHQADVNTLRAELEASTARVMQIEAPARQDEMRAAEARVAAAQAKLDLAKISLSKMELKAPRTGRVLDVNVEPGEMTGPTAAQPLVVLSDTSVVRVRAFVEELDVPRVAPGMQVSVTCDGVSGKEFSGRVATVAPRMIAKSIYAERPGELYDTKVREVLIDLEPNNALIVGLRVDVSFGTANDGSSEKVGVGAPEPVISN